MSDLGIARIVKDSSNSHFDSGENLMASKQVSAAWKKKLFKSRELRGKTAEIVYDRITLLVEIYDDDQFRQDSGDPDDLSAATLLDAEVGDLCADFLELRCVLDSFPNKGDWTDKNLKKLVAAALDGSRTRRKSKKSERRTVTLKEHEKIQVKAGEAEARAAQLGRVLDESQKDMETLRQENQSLREDLAEARGRIRELERRFEYKKSSEMEVVAA